MESAVVSLDTCLVRCLSTTFPFTFPEHQLPVLRALNKLDTKVNLIAVLGQIGEWG
jgi:hypothetical protein